MKQSKPIRKKEFSMLYTSAAEASDWELCKTYALLYFCGFRISEVLQFSNDDIIQAVEKKELEAYISKQHIRRIVPLSADGAALLGMLSSRNERPVFIKQMNTDYLTIKVNAHIRHILGIGYTSHGFRRGYITDLLCGDSSDVAVKEVAAITGHKSTKTVAMYVEVLPEQKRRRIEAVR